MCLFLEIFLGGRPIFQSGCFNPGKKGQGKREKIQKDAFIFFSDSAECGMVILCKVLVRLFAVGASRRRLRNATGCRKLEHDGAGQSGSLHPCMKIRMTTFNDLICLIILMDFAILKCSGCKLVLNYLKKILTFVVRSSYRCTY